MNTLSSVSAQLLTPGGLSLERLPALLGELAGPGIDAADLYFQSQVSESWMLEDGIVKEGSFHLDQGVGVRAQSGEKTGFAYSNSIEEHALRQAVGAARSIARAGQQGRVHTPAVQVPPRLYGADNPLEVLSRAEKVELLKRIDRATRALDPRISRVPVSLAGVWEQVLVAATDGSLGADVRPLVRFNVSVIVEQNGRRERGAHGGGEGPGRSQLVGDLGPDVVLMRVTAAGTRGGTPASLAYEMIDYYDKSAKMTSMMRTTAFPTSTVFSPVRSATSRASHCATTAASSFSSNSGRSPTRVTMTARPSASSGLTFEGQRARLASVSARGVSRPSHATVKSRSMSADT